jgi:hypothetical protein
MWQIALTTEHKIPIKGLKIPAKYAQITKLIEFIAKKRYI